jgi:hypothetical protein
MSDVTGVSGVADPALSFGIQNGGGSVSAHHTHFLPEPVFVNLLRSPVIDSQPGGPVRQPYLTYRPARLKKIGKIDSLESIPGLLKRLQIRAQ